VFYWILKEESEIVDTSVIPGLFITAYGRIKIHGPLDVEREIFISRYRFINICFK
jgi:hypothetical protein